MLELLFLLFVGLELVTIVIYLRLQKHVNQKYPSLRRHPQATTFEKWREQHHVIDILSTYSQAPYQQTKAIGFWMLLAFGCLGGCAASFLVSDFVNWSAFIFPIGLLVSGVGFMHAQRRNLMVQLPAWQALIEHDPETAASFGVTEEKLPQLKLRSTKLMNLYWVWLLAIVFFVIAMVCAISLKY
ncbi:hypothetical protein [Lacticaseibacillus porcinae]|uniref:hypothetical protein n=1 Tax=Lacticaseibacillus porcinae TaxID=1123687 RepID=UPI000F793A13|nr:hypothetical protein [Lacticaseibacillus porcinae]